MKVYPNVTNDKDKGIRISISSCLLYFHSSLQALNPMHQENHMQRVFHHVLQDIGYKKASMSQIMHSSSPS